jgi:superfamily I DNA/RNA helicase
VYLARQHPDARVLLTTFSDALANALRTKIKRLISSEPRLGERIEVHAMNAIGERLYSLHFGRPQLAADVVVKQILLEASEPVEEHRFTPAFLGAEWRNVVDAWQLDTWEKYRDVRRLGRKTRLPESHRRTLWSIFENVRGRLKEQNLVTRAELFGRLADKLSSLKHPPFGFAVVDEAQDISVAQLRFLAALGGNRSNSLFFAGDLGPRRSWR